MGINKSSALTRFIAKYMVDESGCWLWTASKYGNGYGMFYLGQKIVGAHRASWQLFKGGIPSGLFVLHKCDNPACVNPSHLFLGTQKENISDMHKKKRSGWHNDPQGLAKKMSAALRGKNGAKGERNPAAKLTKAQVYKIKGLLAKGCSQQKIGEIFGVCQSTIGNIKTGKKWGETTMTPLAGW